jgi:hypothetical protein
MARALYTNNASTILSVSVNAAETEMTVADGSAFPVPADGNHFYLTFSAPGSMEVVKVTARTGNVLTVVRAQDNTTAASFSSGTTAALRVVAALFDELHTGVALVESTLQGDINTRATITQLNTVESSLTGSIATVSTNLTAETSARTTAISGLQTDINTRATVTQLNTVESSLTGSIATVSTNLTAETNARTTAISGLQDDIDGLQTDVNTRATITQLNSVETSLTGSIATVSTNLTAETNARTTAVSGLQDDIDGLQDDINTRATITQLNTVESSLTGSIGTVSTNLTAETSARIAADGGLQDDIDGLQTDVNTRATITQLNTVETSLTGSIATVSTNLTAETNNRIAAVSSVSSAVSTVDGKLNASYGLTVDGNGRIASMKLLSNGSTSEIAFTADSFKIFNGTSNQAVFTASGGNIFINGSIITTGSVVRGVFASGEVTALTAEGLVANFYSQTTDPGTVANGSLWFKSNTNELYIRISGSWTKLADITPANVVNPPGAVISTAAVYQGLDGTNRTTNAAALTLTGLTGTITYLWQVTSADASDIQVTTKASATCAFRWPSMAGDRLVGISCVVTANEGTFVASGLARWTSLS